MEKPVIISGQTIGPFTKNIDAMYARFCLDRVNMITFRDKEISRERLRLIGVSKPLMLDAADDAMTIPALPKKEALKLLRSNAPASWLNVQGSLIVAMNLKGSLRCFKGVNRTSSLDREIHFMAQTGDRLVETYNAKIVFIPTDYCPDVDDRVVHKEILQRMRQKHGVFGIDQELDDMSLKGIISLADVAIGVRYHFAVFAASTYVPFLGMASGVYQQTKLRGLADLCGLPECFISDDMEFSSPEKVWPRIVSFVNKRHSISKRLADIVPFLEQRSLLAVDTAAQMIRATKADERN